MSPSHYRIISVRFFGWEEKKKVFAYLTWRWNPHRARPIVVHVGEFVGEPLDNVHRESRLVMDHDQVGWGNSPLVHLLGDQVEVVPGGGD